MKTIITLILFSTLTLFAQEEKHEVIPKELADGTLFGNDLDVAIIKVSVTDIFSNPDSYTGKTVLVEGTVSEVCQAMGCWIVITDGTNNIRVMTLHKFFMPKDLGTVKTQVQGVFDIKEITEEQAKHFAEESKNPSVKPEDIKGPQKMYRIKTTGVKVLK